LSLPAGSELGCVANIDDHHIALADHVANLGRVRRGHRGIGFGQHLLDARKQSLTNLSKLLHEPVI
jgi:hypothetical protein